MEQFLGKNAKSPDFDELNFIYCLGFQYSNDSLINFIASKFNVISNKATRKLQVYDWIYALKWILTRYYILDNYEFGACSYNYFNEHLDIDYKLEFWDKALNYLENLESYNEIELVGNKEYITRTIPEYTKEVNTWINKDKNLEENRTDFFSFNVEQQREILNVYIKYQEAESEIENSSDGFVLETLQDDAINMMISSEISNGLIKELKTSDNISLIENVCKHFVQVKKIDPTAQYSDDEIIEQLTKYMFVDNNMILTAYYFQYVIMSMGASIPKNLTKFGVSKVAGKQADVMQRLLCSATTQKWNVINVKGNSYYKTVNNMFKFDKEIDGERENVLKHLAKVRIMLSEGGFSEAIKLLNEDVYKIEAYK